MGKHVGIIREGKELQEGIEKLRELSKRVANVKAHGASQYNPGWHEALSMKSSVLYCKTFSSRKDLSSD
jgi:succinate dehydrogenase / fumarate reductase flavoprotein subunit